MPGQGQVQLRRGALPAKIVHAAHKASLDIIVNFEHLKHATPDALRALMDSDAIRAAIPHVKVRYRTPPSPALVTPLADGTARVAFERPQRALTPGQAAVFYTVAAIASAGQNIVAGSNLYGGTVTLFTSTLSRMGIRTLWVDSDEPDAFANINTRDELAGFEDRK